MGIVDHKNNSKSDWDLGQEGGHLLPSWDVCGTGYGELWAKLYVPRLLWFPLEGCGQGLHILLEEGGELPWQSTVVRSWVPGENRRGWALELGPMRSHYPHPSPTHHASQPMHIRATQNVWGSLRWVMGMNLFPQELSEFSGSGCAPQENTVM
jgi:hypothetical protein